MNIENLLIDYDLKIPETLKDDVENQLIGLNNNISKGYLRHYRYKYAVVTLVFFILLVFFVNPINKEIVAEEIKIVGQYVSDFFRGFTLGKQNAVNHGYNLNSFITERDGFEVRIYNQYFDGYRLDFDFSIHSEKFDPLKSYSYHLSSRGLDNVMTNYSYESPIEGHYEGYLSRYVSIEGERTYDRILKDEVIKMRLFILESDERYVIDSKVDHDTFKTLADFEIEVPIRKEDLSDSFIYPIGKKLLLDQGTIFLDNLIIDPTGMTLETRSEPGTGYDVLRLKKFELYLNQGKYPWASYDDDQINFSRDKQLAQYYLLEPSIYYEEIINSITLRINFYSYSFDDNYITIDINEPDMIVNYHNVELTFNNIKLENKMLSFDIAVPEYSNFELRGLTSDLEFSKDSYTYIDYSGGPIRNIHVETEVDKANTSYRLKLQSDGFGVFCEQEITIK